MLVRIGTSFADVIKAAGGIRTLEEAQTYLELGADRIGSSGLVALAQAQSNG